MALAWSGPRAEDAEKEVAKVVSQAWADPEFKAGHVHTGFVGEFLDRVGQKLREDASAEEAAVELYPLPTTT